MGVLFLAASTSSQESMAQMESEKVIHWTNNDIDGVHYGCYMHADNVQIINYVADSHGTRFINNSTENVLAYKRDGRAKYVKFSKEFPSKCQPNQQPATPQVCVQKVPKCTCKCE